MNEESELNKEIDKEFDRTEELVEEADKEGVTEVEEEMDEDKGKELEKEDEMDKETEKEEEMAMDERVLQTLVHQAFLDSDERGAYLLNLLPSPVTTQSVIELVQGGVLSCLELIEYAGAALYAYARINIANASPLEMANCHLLSNDDLASLSGDGDFIMCTARCNSLLLIAWLVFFDSGLHDCVSASEKCGVMKLALYWWQLRCCYMLQHVRSELSKSLFEAGQASIIKCREELESCTHRLSHVLFHCESTVFYCLYTDLKLATECLDFASAAGDIHLTETGALGKRTHYQRKYLAQMCVQLEFDEFADWGSRIDAESSDETTEKNDDVSGVRVQHVELKDDVRMDDIVFASEEEQTLSGVMQTEPGNVSGAADRPSITCRCGITETEGSPIRESEVAGKARTKEWPIDRQAVLACYVMASFNVLQIQCKSHPSSLSSERLMAHLSLILRHCSKDRRQAEHRVPWSVETVALLRRSQVELAARRSRQRAVLQLQAIVDATNAVARASHTSPADCDPFLFASSLPPFWDVRHIAYRGYIRINALKSALDLALANEDTRGVVACYRGLGLIAKAADLIERKMQEEGRRCVAWLCLIAEVTFDASYMREALKVSNGRSAKAHTLLGEYHYAHKEYAKSLEHYNASLAICPYQLEALLRVGYISMKSDDWAGAVSAYTRYHSYDTENFQTWNNLAKAYVQLNQIGRAHTVLQEAVKCDFQNWKLWDNLALVSLRVKDFSGALRAYHRLIELKVSEYPNHLDMFMLNALADASGVAMTDVKAFGSTPVMLLTDDANPSYVASLVKLLHALTSASAGAAMPGDNAALWALLARATHLLAYATSPDAVSSKHRLGDAPTSLTVCGYYRQAVNATSFIRTGTDTTESTHRKKLAFALEYASAVKRLSVCDNDASNAQAARTAMVSAKLKLKAIATVCKSHDFHAYFEYARCIASVFNVKQTVEADNDVSAAQLTSVVAAIEARLRH